MKLREKIVLSDFLNTVRQCGNDVLFITKEGDRLNLKSQLSQYVLLAVADSDYPLRDGEVICANEGDYVNLKQFLESGSCNDEDIDGII